MAAQSGQYHIIFTVDPKRYPNVTEAWLNNRFNAMCANENSYANNHGVDWHIKYTVSDRDPKTGEPEPLHIHSVLTSNPSRKQAERFRHWWSNRIGHVRIQRINDEQHYCYLEEEYIPKQAVCNPHIRRSTGFAKSPLAVALDVNGYISNSKPVLDISVLEIDSNSVNTLFVPESLNLYSDSLSTEAEYLVPVYDVEICRFVEEPMSLGDLPVEVAIAIITQSECHDVNIVANSSYSDGESDTGMAVRDCESRHSDIADDNPQSVDQPVDGITDQARVSLVYFEGDNAVPMAWTCEFCNSVDIGTSRMGGWLWVHNGPSGVIRHDYNHNPGFYAAISDVAPMTILPRAGPLSAAPISVTPVS